MLRPCVVTAENGEAFFSFLPAELTAWKDHMLLLGLEEDGEPCGLLAGAPTEDVFELRSLYVRPEYRRRGGGLRLLEVLVAVLTEEPDLRAIRCTWTETEETAGTAFLLATAGFTVSVADGVGTAEIVLKPTEDLGALLADLSD